jgi:hypothetical protein
LDSVFHFLNRMYAEGSEIVMPFRTITKISPNPFCLINTFAGQIEELGSSSRGAIGKGADPILLYAIYIRGCFDAAIHFDTKICSNTAAHTAVVMLAPKFLGGWGVSRYQDVLTNERTDALRSVNTVIHRLAQVYPVSKFDYRDDAGKIIAALYYPGFREPQVFGFLAATRAVCVAGVTDPTGPLRLAVTSRLKGIGVCTELQRAFALDENPDLAADM